MSEYNFTTHWHFDQPLEMVWEIIRLMDNWPEWWKYVREVKKIREGDENEIGAVRRITWSTALPYSITFDSELTSLIQYKSMEGKAFGDLTGIGVWTFEQNGIGTNVRYDWKVSISKPWMKFLEPLLKPIFKWNHDKVMMAGYEGLTEKLLATDI
jgi:hypothetical protein